VSAAWFGSVYLLVALAGLGLSAGGGSDRPLGLPLDCPRSVAIGAIGLVAVLASRGRQAIKTGLLVGGLGALATLAVIGMVQGG